MINCQAASAIEPNSIADDMVRMKASLAGLRAGGSIEFSGAPVSKAMF